ncbi:hypothetical protein FRC12_017212 [Ceratobasidium sp. 428]|nr:hypothetical protein FRC12_017212 [Ceratobasidium sp. 428]
MMRLQLPPIRDLHLSQPDYALPPPRDERLAKVLAHCQALCAFADHYATVAPSPDQSEMAQMIQRAVEVIDILRDYKDAACPPPAMPVSATAARPPKRPWEDAVEEQSGRRVAASPPADRPSPASSSSPAPRVSSGPEAHMHVFDGLSERTAPLDDDAKAAAVRDMEDIRARRAAGNGANQGKTKYKKRSRASPPGQCHSCEILDTPEWRRGPDGQRTLCNACGLHYAKLVRKRDRIISTLPTGSQPPPPIDITYLRKSARMAAENSALARSVGRRRRDDDQDKTPKAESKHTPSDSESGASRDAGSGRRGWSRREEEDDELMRSPSQSAFPRASATSPYLPPQPAPQMSPNHMSPTHATSPAQPVTLPPPPPAPVHNNSLPSMRPSYPPPMTSYPPPLHPAYQAYPQPPVYPPMQQPYGPPGYPQQAPVMAGPMPQPQPSAWDRYVAGINGREPRA